MLHVFEVYLAPGFDPDALLSPDQIRDTAAQVMTLDEARALGLSAAAKPDGRDVRLVAVAARDAQWIHRTLESSAAVTSYKVHEIDL